MKKKSFKMSEVKPRIFFLDFENQYDCSMTFLRYQEYYESPNSKFRGKQFEIIEFMEWYSQKYGQGAFTYAVDWDGFNIPAKVIDNILRMGITDYNMYDGIMEDVWNKCLQKYPDEKFYIIGAVGQGLTMKHEIAHGFFYTQPKYKKAMAELVKSLPKKYYKSMCDDLERIGYAPKVYIDECQAYLATGLPDSFKTRYAHSQPFVKVYNAYYNL